MSQPAEEAPVYGVHATNPTVVNGVLTCSVCGQGMIVLAPEVMEHNTDTGTVEPDPEGDIPDEG